MRYAALLILAGCASSSEPMAVRFANAPPVMAADDRRPVASAPSRNLNLNDFDFYDRAFEDPVTRSLELPGHRRARGVNALDEVPDSTWFTNRIGVRDLTPDEIRRGPVDDDGPEAHTPWTVHSTKPGGTELGFVITDARGVKYLISFDEISRPEMETGSAVVVNRLLWAAGYNVPADSVAYIRRDQLVVAPDAMLKDHLGHDRGALDVALFDLELRHAWRTPDGRLRVFASRYLAGESLGGGPTSGVRDDDPNDRIPHELRRDQRGLFPLTAWVDHVDLVQSNFLDMFVNDRGARYVVHYLVDFGKSLGTMGVTDSYIRVGWNYSFDWRFLFRDIFTLGLAPRPWNRRLRPVPVGVSPAFDSERFDPARWRPDIPVPAFDEADRYDMFWGAKLVARFTREQIQAAVEAGRFTDPQAVAYLTDTLVARQQATLRYWFSRVNPLDGFAATGRGLCFSDLAIAHGLAPAEGTSYALTSYDAGGRRIGAVTVPAVATGPTCTPDVIMSTAPDTYTIVKITTQRPTFSGSTFVHVARAPTGEWRVIGVWRI
jgi:hypothetical protein